MKKIIYTMLFIFLTILSFAKNYSGYLGDIEFVFNQEDINCDSRTIPLPNAQANLSSYLVLNENYKLFCYNENISRDYLKHNGYYNNSSFVIQLELEKRALWEENFQKILRLEGQSKIVGQVILKKSNDVEVAYYDIKFTVPKYNIEYITSENKIVFDFTPLYKGETNSTWWVEKSSTVTITSDNLPPLKFRVYLEPVSQEFEFLSDELTLTGTQEAYFSGNPITFDVRVGTNVGNHYNNYGTKLQEMYFEAGCPPEGLHVADAIVSVPMEGGYYFYLDIPVYYLIAEPSINIVVDESFHLVFNPANPENGYTSVVPVTITSSIPSFNINLNLEIFNEYNLLNNYIFLINYQTIPVSNGEYSFYIELKANFADLWNEQKDKNLILFQEGVMTVSNDMHIGNVYITLSAS